MTRNNNLYALAQELSDQFSKLPQVEAVALGGSAATGALDPGSDIDLYIFTVTTIPLETRKSIVQKRGTRKANLDLQYWDLGDQWFDYPSGIEVDIIFWDKKWIEGQIDRVLVDHQASIGYTTCHWHTIKGAKGLFDREVWFKVLQEKCMVLYPETLRTAIIQQNYPILRDVIPSYLHQIEKAVQRADLVSINHRVAALLASYFDIVFALYRIPHPGEKRLLQFLRRERLVPEEMILQVESLLHVSTSIDTAIVHTIDELINSLDLLLEAEGVQTKSSYH